MRVRLLSDHIFGRLANAAFLASIKLWDQLNACQTFALVFIGYPCKRGHSEGVPFRKSIFFHYFWNIVSQKEQTLKSIISHSKEYGFVFPSSEIYDGLAAFYDYGPFGVELKNNIKQLWYKSMVQLNENIVGLDSAIFMNPTVWKASGHVDSFNDPMIDNKDSKKRYRADVLLEDQAAI